MTTNAEHPHVDTTAEMPGHSPSPWDPTTGSTSAASAESPWFTPPAAPAAGGGGTALPPPPVAGPPSGTHRLPPWRRRAVGTATLVAVALGGGATGAAVTARYVERPDRAAGAGGRGGPAQRRLGHRHDVERRGRRIWRHPALGRHHPDQQPRGRGGGLGHVVVGQDGVVRAQDDARSFV